MESPTGTPRPHPRFAGFETLVIMGAEAVARGWTEGDTGLVVGSSSRLWVGLAGVDGGPLPGSGSSVDGGLPPRLGRRRGQTPGVSS